MSDSGGINNEMTKLAEYASTTAKEKFGCILDFSENSLVQLESLLDQAYQHFSQLAKEGKSRKESVQNTANVWGSYLGEVVRRKWGGTWSRKTNDAVLVINGNDIAPVAFVYQRITRQPQYKVAQYYADTTAKLNTQPQEQALSNESPIFAELSDGVNRESALATKNDALRKDNKKEIRSTSNGDCRRYSNYSCSY